MGPLQDDTTAMHSDFTDRHSVRHSLGDSYSSGTNIDPSQFELEAGSRWRQRGEERYSVKESHRGKGLSYDYLHCDRPGPSDRASERGEVPSSEPAIGWKKHFKLEITSDPGGLTNCCLAAVRDVTHLSSNINLSSSFGIHQCWSSSYLSRCFGAGLVYHTPRIAFICSEKGYFWASLDFEH